MGVRTSVTRHATATVVGVAGDIDMHTAPEVRDALVDAMAAGGDLVVDLTETDFLDSTALGALVGVDNRLRATGRGLVVVCPSVKLRKVFQITRLDTLWTIHARLEDALTGAG